MADIKNKYLIDFDILDSKGKRLGLIVEEVEMNGFFGYIVIATKNSEPYGPGQRYKFFKNKELRDKMLSIRIKNSRKRFLKKFKKLKAN